MLIENAMPHPTVVIAVHAVVDADLATTYTAARTLDFLSVRAPLVTLSLWLRGLPARLFGRSQPAPLRLSLADGMGLPGWLLLGERPDKEIAFGAVGTFWKPTIQWRTVESTEFADFSEPGWGKIAANFSVVPYGSNTLLSYECRTMTTDLDSRRRFMAYWIAIRPFVSHIMRATVATIKENAEAG